MARRLSSSKRPGIKTSRRKRQTEISANLAADAEASEIISHKTRAYLPADTSDVGFHAERAHPVDVPAVKARIEQLKKLLAQKRRPDVVERSWDLPLVLDEESRERAFVAALAELEFPLQTDRTNGAAVNDFKLLMSGNFGRNIVEQFHRSTTWSALHKPSYRHYERDRIIGLVYPWYNYSLYTDLLRIVRESNLDINAFSGITGEYRYFRFFPQDDKHFTLMDGWFKIEIDKQHNMLCFGQRSMNHHGKGYEHRGFVFPGADKVDFLTFRGGTMRLGAVHGDLDRRCNAILLSATRGNKRPFAARVLIVKKGQDLYELEIPLVEGKQEFRVDTDEYRQVREELGKVIDDTVVLDAGFMWGDKPKSISDD